MKAKPILIVDDEPSMRSALAESLQSCGYAVETADDGAEALMKFEQGRFRIVITDMRMPKMSGLDVLKGVKRHSPATPVILITAYGTVNTAVEAMKEGAAEFIMKPFSLDDLEIVVRNVLKTSGDSVADSKLPVDLDDRDRRIISSDGKIDSILETLRHVAKSRSTVLIEGESGTGKELFARYIYRHSPRRNMPFVAVNCAAIPGNLLESEMFGYEKGAFTGALQRKVGKFELADGGTLLLDEVSEMDGVLQAKLLRVLQECEVDRLGGRSPVKVDVRIIATTNRDLKKCMEEKVFREDLYYRLNVVPVRIPPLRERTGDIPPLVDYFLRKYSQLNNQPKPRLSEGAFSSLRAYHWPGNVRELENAIERAVLISKDLILPTHLGLDNGNVQEEHVTAATPVFQLPDPGAA
ncbi:MAG: sigma-54-dependent Fis family transcriptional regulator, partial [Deltaproteobacteria bacterium]|nr:sigma-54-dependent Fis family transcriptional regulator [Deltaproteobacteria bacterium]